MVTAGFVLHAEERRAAELVIDAADWLTARGHDVRLPDADAQLVGRPELGVPEHRFAAGLDVAVSLGGDGTMLRAIDMVVADDVPVIGVNLGQLGYLTEVEPGGLRMAVKRFLSGAYETQDRMLLSVTGPDGVPMLALNELVVEKTAGSAVRVAVSVDGGFFTTYAADGLIVATPTGSTAYSLSARGPVVAPTHRCLLVTAVAPHMLFDRTLVLDPDADVRLEVLAHRPAAATVDGRRMAIIEPGQAVHATSAQSVARLVTFGDHDFLGILKTKFGLEDR